MKDRRKEVTRAIGNQTQCSKEEIIEPLLYIYF